MFKHNYLPQIYHSVEEKKGMSYNYKPNISEMVENWHVIYTGQGYHSNNNNKEQSYRTDMFFS